MCLEKMRWGPCTCLRVSCVGVGVLSSRNKSCATTEVWKKTTVRQDAPYVTSRFGTGTWRGTWKYMAQVPPTTHISFATLRPAPPSTNGRHITPTHINSKTMRPFPGTPYHVTVPTRRKTMKWLTAKMKIMMTLMEKMGPIVMLVTTCLVTRQTSQWRRT